MIRESRALSELPYSNYLDPIRGGLVPYGDYDTVHADGLVFDKVEAGNCRFTESALSMVDFTGGKLRAARFNDVWFHTVRWVGTDLVDTTWLDVEMTSIAMAGIECYGSEFRRVVFHNCKFDSVNWRSSTFHDVHFVDCMLRDVDLSGASLVGASFPGSTIERLVLNSASLSKVDLRGAISLGVSDGVTALKGATISEVQLVELAPSFAHALGVVVKDS